jgi:hypothetical protein
MRGGIAGSFSRTIAMNLLKTLGLKKKKPKKRAIDPAFEYGTHLPVLKSILETFHPRGALELGAGRYSTPLLYHHVDRLVTIDNDPKWVGEVASLVPPRKNFSLIHHSLPGLTAGTRHWEVPQRTKQQCIAYYREVVASNPGMDLLFIDHISGLRSCALVALYDQFDFVVYHDAEDKGYGYEQFAQHDNGDFLHFLLKPYIPYTGFLIRKKHADRVEELCRLMDQHALAYYTDFYRFALEDLTSTAVRPRMAG